MLHAEQRCRRRGRDGYFEVGSPRDVGTPGGASIGRWWIACGGRAFAPHAVAQDVTRGAVGLEMRGECACVRLLERGRDIERRGVRRQLRRPGVDRAQRPSEEGVRVGSVVALVTKRRRSHARVGAKAHHHLLEARDVGVRASQHPGDLRRRSLGRGVVVAFSLIVFWRHGVRDPARGFPIGQSREHDRRPVMSISCPPPRDDPLVSVASGSQRAAPRAVQCPSCATR